MLKASAIIVIIVFFIAPLAYGIEKTDINTATEKELIRLPGIGREIAKRIIEYREAKGGFTNIEELTNVKGIGEKRFTAIKGLILVKDKETSAVNKNTVK